MFDTNRFINLSLPSDWMLEIQQRAEHHQLTAEEWLHVEVAKLLGKPDPRSTIEINKRLAALEAQVAAIPRLEHQLQTLLVLIQQLSPAPPISQSPVSPSPVSPSSSVSVSLPEDDDDEPDEILYDFLDR